jgi:hypothetical protein
VSDDFGHHARVLRRLPRRFEEYGFYRLSCGRFRFFVEGAPGNIQVPDPDEIDQEVRLLREVVEKRSFRDVRGFAEFLDGDLLERSRVETFDGSPQERLFRLGELSGAGREAGSQVFRTLFRAIHLLYFGVEMFRRRRKPRRKKGLFP